MTNSLQWETRSLDGHEVKRSEVVQSCLTLCDPAEVQPQLIQGVRRGDGIGKYAGFN